MIKSETNACFCTFVFQRDHLKIAQQFFQLVGGSASECGTLNRNLINMILKSTLYELVCIIYFWLSDTIPGRQCMASCFFLLRQFEDVLIYLNSVKVSLAQYKAHIVWYIFLQRITVVVLYCAIKKKTPTHWVIDRVTSDDKWCFTNTEHLFSCVFFFILYDLQDRQKADTCMHFCLNLNLFIRYNCAFLFAGLLL